MATPKRNPRKQAAQKAARRGTSSGTATPPGEERRARAPRIRRESVEDPLADWPEEDYEADPLGIERPGLDIERDEG